MLTVARASTSYKQFLCDQYVIGLCCFAVKATAEHCQFLIGSVKLI